MAHNKPLNGISQKRLPEQKKEEQKQLIQLIVYIGLLGLLETNFSLGERKCKHKAVTATTAELKVFNKQNSDFRILIKKKEKKKRLFRSLWFFMASFSLAELILRRQQGQRLLRR
jgi:hypothetical protein